MTGPQDSLANIADKIGVLQQVNTRPLGWDREHDLESELRPDDADGLDQVRVIGNDEGGLAVLPKSVEQKIGRQIDVRPLLVSSEYPYKPRASSRRILEWHCRRVRPEMTERDFEIRDRGERAQEDLLANRSIWIAKKRSDARGKVANPLHLSVVRQDQPCQPGEIQPLVGSALDAAIVEVEPVDVNVGNQSLKMAEVAFLGATSHPIPEGIGVVTRLIPIPQT